MAKLYYSISEVSELLNEEQYILRYWEKEFNELKPKKNRGGNRIYSNKDLNLLKTIKNLIRNEHLSLIGVKEKLKKINIENNNSSIDITFDNKTVDFKSNNFVEIIENSELFNSKIEFSKEDIKELYFILKDISNYLKQ